ncbi:MAG: 3'-5' exonuclease [Victivallaceae bacterium]
MDGSVDIRGRSFSLRVNYRTSHQIRCHADALLPSEISDVDGNKEDRRGTISVFDGIEPVIKVFDSEEQETKAVALWLKSCKDQEVPSHEIGIFVRSDEQLSRAEAAVAGAGLRGQILDDNMKVEQDFVTIGTMHLAKGLEFRAVAVMACDDEVIPLQSRIDKVTDEADLDDVYHTERYLLYVSAPTENVPISLISNVPISPTGNKNPSSRRTN